MSFSKYESDDVSTNSLLAAGYAMLAEVVAAVASAVPYMPTLTTVRDGRAAVRGEGLDVIVEALRSTGIPEAISVADAIVVGLEGARSRVADIDDLDIEAHAAAAEDRYQATTTPSTVSVGDEPASVDDEERARTGLPAADEPDLRSAEASNGRTDGDPVDLFSGFVRHIYVDLAVPTPDGLIEFRRTYASGSRRLGPLGFNWDHNWNVYLRELADGRVARWTGQLREEHFTHDGTIFQPPRGVSELLVAGTLGEPLFTSWAPGQVRSIYDRPPGWTDAARIPLVEIRHPTGRTIILTYDAENRVSSVLDQDGRGLLFVYGHCGFLERLTDHAGRTVTYWHDVSSEFLARCILPGTSDYPEGVCTTYEYDYGANHPDVRPNLLRIIDHDGRVVVQNTFDPDPASPWFNRVREQWQGGHRWRFSYGPWHGWLESDEYLNTAVRWTFADRPDGTRRVAGFNFRGDILVDRTQPFAGNTISSSTVRFEYDSAGNLTTRTLEDGSSISWTFTHDAEDPRNRANLIQRELRPALTAPGVPSRVVFTSSIDPTWQAPLWSKDEAGHVTSFEYDFTDGNPSPAGLLKRVLLPDATLPDGTTQTTVRELEHDAFGRLSADEMTSGTAKIRTEWTRYPSGSADAGRVASLVEDATGIARTTTYTYDGAGFLASETKPGSRLWQYTADAHGREVAVTAPAISGLTATTERRYNAMGLLSAARSPRGSIAPEEVPDSYVETRFHYAPSGYLIERTEAANSATPRRFRYEPRYDGKVERAIGPDGIATTTRYNIFGEPVRTTLGAGLPEQLASERTFDDVGRLRYELDAGGRSTEYRYDGFGRLTQVVRPSGVITSTIYGARDEVTKIEVLEHVDPGLVVRSRVEYEYDERGRRTHEHVYSFLDDVATASVLTTKLFHDGFGRIVRIVSPRGGESTTSFDGLGRPVIESDALGNETVHTWDTDESFVEAEMRAVTSGGIVSLVTRTNFDARGRVVSVVDAAGNKTSTTYDDRDVATSIIDPLGTRTTMTVDAHGQRTSLTRDADGLGLTQYWSYDIAGRVDSTTDPVGRVRVSTYDSLGRLAASTDPLLRATTFSYHPSGDLAAVTRPSGCVVEYEYDLAGRLATVTPSAPVSRDPVAPLTYVYDAFDRVVEVNQGASTWTRKYDSIGRLREDASDTHAFIATWRDLDGEYDLEFPSGRVETHRLDLLGRTRQIELSAPGTSAVAIHAGTAGELLVDVAYWGRERIEQVSLPGNVKELREYDAAGRLVHISSLDGSGAVVCDRWAYRDASSRLRAVHVAAPVPATESYEFDAAGRVRAYTRGFNSSAAVPSITQPDLNSAIAAIGSDALSAVAAGTATLEDYLVDASDARTKVTITAPGTGPTAVPSTYNGAGEPATLGTDGLTHDNDGLRTQDADHLYTYDALGRATRIRTSGGTLVQTREYDGFGRWRGGTNTGATFERLAFDASPLAWTEGGVTSRELTSIDRSLVPRIETTQIGRWSSHADGRGSRIAVTNLSGSIEERYDYRLFGQGTVYAPDGITARASSAIGLDPWWAGLHWSAATETYATARRDFDPDEGWWRAPDPLGDVDSTFLYGFAGHDPADFADPTGLVAQTTASGTSDVPTFSPVDAAAIMLWGGVAMGRNAANLRRVRDVETAQLRDARSDTDWTDNLTLTIGGVVGDPDGDQLNAILQGLEAVLPRQADATPVLIWSISDVRTPDAAALAWQRIRATGFATAALNPQVSWLGSDPTDFLLNSGLNGLGMTIQRVHGPGARAMLFQVAPNRTAANAFGTAVHEAVHALKNRWFPGVSDSSPRAHLDAVVAGQLANLRYRFLEGTFNPSEFDRQRLWQGTKKFALSSFGGEGVPLTYIGLADAGEREALLHRYRKDFAELFQGSFDDDKRFTDSIYSLARRP